MNEEQNQVPRQSSANPAGEDGFSRSEKLSSPATPPPRGGASPPDGPGPVEASDPVWAELVGDADHEVDDGEIPEAFPEAVRRTPLRVPRTKRRGTLAPPAERPLLPLSPTQ